MAVPIYYWHFSLEIKSIIIKNIEEMEENPSLFVFARHGRALMGESPEYA